MTKSRGYTMIKCRAHSIYKKRMQSFAAVEHWTQMTRLASSWLLSWNSGSSESQADSYPDSLHISVFPPSSTRPHYETACMLSRAQFPSPSQHLMENGNDSNEYQSIPINWDPSLTSNNYSAKRLTVTTFILREKIELGWKVKKLGRMKRMLNVVVQETAPFL